MFCMFATLTHKKSIIFVMITIVKELLVLYWSSQSLPYWNNVYQWWHCWVTMHFMLYILGRSSECFGWKSTALNAPCIQCLCSFLISTSLTFQVTQSNFFRLYSKGSHSNILVTTAHVKFSINVDQFLFGLGDTMTAL